MGKKTPPKGELEGSPRKAKAPRLDLSALVAAASAPEASNRMEEGAEGTSGNDRCNHALIDSARTRLSLSLLSKDAGACVGCRREDAKGPRYRKQRPLESSILMCLECGRHLCCGVGGIEYPFGHSRAHAMKKRHWVAALYDDAENGYCFKCNAEVGMPTEFEVDGHVIGIDVIRNVVSWLPKRVPRLLSGLMGHARLRLEGTGDNRCNQEEGRASGFDSGLLNLGDKQHSHEFGSAIGQEYTIRGIPNISNTCYMNAIVQCLLVLDKLRARMLALDAPNSLIGMVFKELFVETGAPGDMLDLLKLLTLIRMRKDSFKPGTMEDSHELLVSLRNILNEDEKSQSGAPAVMGSIFEIELSDSLVCQCGFSKLSSHSLVYELSLALPSKGHPTKSAASLQTSESPKSQQNKIYVQLFPANEHSNLEKIQTAAEIGGSRLLSSELKDVVVEEAPEPLEVDSTEVQHISQRKDVVQGPLQIQKNKVSSFEFSQGIINVPVKSVNFLPHIMSDVKVEEMNEMKPDSIVSIEDCLLLFSEHETEWLCDNCENDRKMVGSANEGTTVVGDQTEQSDRRTCQNEQSSEPSSLSVECKSSSSRQPHASDAHSQIVQTVDRITEGTSSGMSYGEKDSVACSKTNKEPECHEGILRAEKQTDLLRAEHSEDVSRQLVMYQDTMKQLELYSSAHRLKDGKNEQKDKAGDATQTCLLKKLPPVLTLHLWRAGTRHNFNLKNCEYVRFEEYLDVGRFMDPSSVDKGNSLYRLAGVVEHRGSRSLNEGHYVAYVRARKLENQQHQSSCSSSWFCADDTYISPVTLEEVLKRQAYILFDERVEG